jgi:hypothetical protein
MAESEARDSGLAPLGCAITGFGQIFKITIPRDATMMFFAVEIEYPIIVVSAYILEYK